MVAEPKKSSRWMRVVLVASLGLNLAIAGLAIGSLVSGKFGDGPPRSYNFGLGPVARALDPADRKAVGMALRRTRPMTDVDLRAQVHDMIAAVRADPFDAAALRALLAAQNVRTAALQTNAQNVLIDHIAAMPAAARIAFADRLMDELVRLRHRDVRPSGG